MKTLFDVICFCSSGLDEVQPLSVPQESPCSTEPAKPEQPSKMPENAQTASGVTQIPASDIELLTKIGDGSYSAVFRAKWKDQSVAVKQIKKILPWQREIAIMSRLTHPNIVKLHGVVTFKGDPYPSIVMELKSKNDLFELISNDCNREYVILERDRIFQEIASGLEYLHKNRVIHRDIKLENILLGEGGGTVALTDFGLAVALNGNDEAYYGDEGVGSPCYAAPEVLRRNQQGKIVYTTKADVFSLGCVLYVLWHFRSTYHNERTDNDVLQAKLRGYHGNISRSTPTHICALITNMWSMDPKERLPAADIIPMLTPHSGQKNRKLD